MVEWTGSPDDPDDCFCAAELGWGLNADLLDVVNDGRGDVEATAPMFVVVGA